MFLFWFCQMLLPMILGNLALFVDVIAMLSLGLQLMLHKRKHLLHAAMQKKSKVQNLMTDQIVY